MITVEHLKLTKQNIKNLILLMHGLRRPLVAEFDMGLYVSEGGGREVNAHTCGAAACAIGWSRELVTPMTEGEMSKSIHGEMYYAQRVYGVSTGHGIDTVGMGLDQSLHTARWGAWSWMFGPSWKNWDNTPTGAADRIEYFLVRGVPEGYCEEQWEEGWSKRIKFPNEKDYARAMTLVVESGVTLKELLP